MNGLTLCFHKGTCGPPSLPSGLPQRWSRSELFAKNGADCRPSTCGWTSRLPGIYYTIVCTRRLPLGCLVNNYLTCCLTEPPRATREIPIKRKHTVDQTTMKSGRVGSKVNGGCGTTKTNVRRRSWKIDTYMDYCFTFVYPYLTSTSLCNFMLQANSHQVYPAEHSRRRYATYSAIQNSSIFHPLEPIGPSPSDGWHACSRRCQLALDLPVRGTGLPHPPIHSPGDCYVVGVVLLFILDYCLNWKTFPVICDFSLIFRWQNGRSPGQRTRWAMQQPDKKKTHTWITVQAVANKGGHIPAQTAKTLTWCERSARAGRWRSGHDGHLINYLDGMEDILQGRRDEMRGFGGARRFHHFCKNFHRLFVCLFLFALLVFGCLFVVFSASQPVKRLLQVIHVSPFLLSHISRVDRPCSVLARQCRKKKVCHQRQLKILLKRWLSLKIVIKDCPKFCWRDGCH